MLQTYAVCVKYYRCQVPSNSGEPSAKAHRAGTGQPNWFGCTHECDSMFVSEQAGKSVHRGFSWLRGVMEWVWLGERGGSCDGEFLRMALGRMG